MGVFTYAACSLGAKPQLRHSPFLHNAQIYGKAEFLNPGGSVKDRVALQVVREALDRGELQKGDLITEGTAGSTGISLAMVRCALHSLHQMGTNVCMLFR